MRGTAFMEKESVKRKKEAIRSSINGYCQEMGARQKKHLPLQAKKQRTGIL